MLMPTLLNICLLAVVSQEYSETDYSVSLQNRDFVAAVAAAENLAKPLDRSRAQVESRFWAGDLTGAYATALIALESHPEDPRLLHRGAELAVQLLQTDQGADWAQRLAAVAQTDATLTPEQGEFYQRQAELNLREATRLKSIQASEQNALAWARGTAGLFLLVGLWILARFWGRPAAPSA